jgi:hypothetical protein
MAMFAWAQALPNDRSHSNSNHLSSQNSMAGLNIPSRLSCPTKKQVIF